MNVRQLAARIEAEQNVQPRGSPVDAAGIRDPARSFAEALQRVHRTTPPGLTVSAHAQERIAQRGISLTPAEQASLGEALSELDAKGARDALVLRPDAAFVVNVPSRTVITAVAQEDLEARIFTQIDSTMLL